MFEYKITGPDYSLAFSSLSRRVAAAHAYFESGETKLAQKEIVEAMAVIRQVEMARFTVDTAK
jgi:hypothetical protein